MKILVKILLILLIAGAYGCKEVVRKSNDKAKAKKEIIVEKKDSVAIAKSNNKKRHRSSKKVKPQIKGYDYSLDIKIRKAVSSIIDTNNIYKIYQYDDHYVVHYLDFNDRTKTAEIYLNKDLEITRYLNFVDSNPYHLKGLKVIALELGNPVYDLKGKTRKEVEEIIPNIKWDNTGEPIVARLWSGGSNFAPNRTATLYQIYIDGTEGSMAVNSMLRILDKYGNKIDSLEFTGQEIWHPRVTNDGRYLAYLYGRAYPDGEEGKVTQNMVIYDIDKKEIIFEKKNFLMVGSSIASNDNFFQTAMASNKNLYSRWIFDCKKQKIYIIHLNSSGTKNWGSFKEDGIYDRYNPDKRLLSWNKDFEVMEFSK